MLVGGTQLNTDNNLPASAEYTITITVGEDSVEVVWKRVADTGKARCK